MISELIFWSAFIILFYSYLGYGLIIFIVNVFKGSNEEYYNKEYKPAISFIIPAYNEEDFIREKVENTLSLDYPSDKLNIIVISDGSTDNTNEILKEYPQIAVHFKNARKGKVAAINRVMQYVQTDIVIFSDTNTTLNNKALLEMVKHYQNTKVGAVSGEKVVLKDTKAGISNNEGLYWKYESFLKKQDSDFYSLVGAAGELFSMRTNLFKPLKEDTILDDFMLSLKVNLEGFTVKYEPKAKASELPSDSITEERKRKIRISAGAFQSMSRLPELLNIFINPKLSFLYLSHRVSRWTICPISLVALYIFNINLIGVSELYTMFFLLQNMFYLFAVLGYWFSLKAFQIPQYFVFMNISVVQGFIRFIRKNQPSAWERAKRLQYN